MKNCYVGFDTSNYTTSIGIVDEQGNILANIKKLLSVGEGKCGLRQSDAVFAHTKNFPELTKEAEKILKEYSPLAIGYSSKPRNVDGSYMPCFLCGEAFANAFCLGRDVKLYEFSHQCGHISASLLSSDIWGITDNEFVAFHISGGTTEVILCKKSGSGFSTEIIGGTKDLSAGQAIDRAGVMMGMAFPCGKELEGIAATYKGRIEKPRISVQDTFCNLSGLQNIAQKVYSDTGDSAKTSLYVINFLAETLYKMALNVREKYSDVPMVFGGGVASNKLIRDKLTTLGDVHFAHPSLSCDNAVGIAELARREHLENL